MAKLKVPAAVQYGSIVDYFWKGVGEPAPSDYVVDDQLPEAQKSGKNDEGFLDPETLASLKELPHKEYEDGKRKLVQHSKLERIRNPKLVRDAKKAFKHEKGTLYCEVCAFDFEANYGDRGKDFIEAHHRKPISKIDGQEAVKLTIKDLAMVCSNCHRMLHRVPWLSIDDLKKLLKKA
jgi:5-methylcytosine-specific restriction enzyme A